MTILQPMSESAAFGEQPLDDGTVAFATASASAWQPKSILKSSRRSMSLSSVDLNGVISRPSVTVDFTASTKFHDTIIGSDSATMETVTVAAKAKKPPSLPPAYPSKPRTRPSIAPQSSHADSLPPSSMLPCQSKAGLLSDREIENSLQDIASIVGDITTHDWEKRIHAMQRVIAIVAGCQPPFTTFLTQFRYVRDGLASQLLDLRSSVVREACMLLSHLSTVIGDDMVDHCDILVPYLIKLLGVSVQVIANNASQCLSSVISHTRLHRGLTKLIDTCQSPATANIARTKSMECVYQWLTHYQSDRQYVDKYQSALEALIIAKITDRTEEVRVLARKCFVVYESIWRERGHVIGQTFDDKVKKMLTQEKKNVTSAVPTAVGKPPIVRSTKRVSMSVSHQLDASDQENQRPNRCATRVSVAPMKLIEASEKPTVPKIGLHVRRHSSAPAFVDTSLSLPAVHPPASLNATPATRNNRRESWRPMRLLVQPSPPMTSMLPAAVIERAHSLKSASDDTISLDAISSSTTILMPVTTPAPAFMPVSEQRKEVEENEPIMLIETSGAISHGDEAVRMTENANSSGEIKHASPLHTNTINTAITLSVATTEDIDDRAAGIASVSDSSDGATALPVARRTAYENLLNTDIAAQLNAEIEAEFSATAAARKSLKHRRQSSVITLPSTNTVALREDDSVISGNRSESHVHSQTDKSSFVNRRQSMRLPESSCSQTAKRSHQRQSSLSTNTVSVRARQLSLTELLASCKDSDWSTRIQSLESLASLLSSSQSFQSVLLLGELDLHFEKFLFELLERMNDNHHKVAASAASALLALLSSSEMLANDSKLVCLFALPARLLPHLHQLFPVLFSLLAAPHIQCRVLANQAMNGLLAHFTHYQLIAVLMRLLAEHTSNKIRVGSVEFLAFIVPQTLSDTESDSSVATSALSKLSVCLCDAKESNAFKTVVRQLLLSVYDRAPTTLSLALNEIESAQKRHIQRLLDISLTVPAPMHAQAVDEEEKYEDTTVESVDGTSDIIDDSHTSNDLASMSMDEASASAQAIVEATPPTMSFEEVDTLVVHQPVGDLLPPSVLAALPSSITVRRSERRESLQATPSSPISHYFESLNRVQTPKFAAPLSSSQSSPSSSAFTSLEAVEALLDKLEFRQRSVDASSSSTGPSSEFSFSPSSPFSAVLSPSHPINQQPPVLQSHAETRTLQAISPPLSPKLCQQLLVTPTLQPLSLDAMIPSSIMGSSMVSEPYHPLLNAPHNMPVTATGSHSFMQRSRASEPFARHQTRSVKTGQSVTSGTRSQSASKAEKRAEAQRTVTKKPAVPRFSVGRVSKPAVHSSNKDTASPARSGLSAPRHSLTTGNSVGPLSDAHLTELLYQWKHGEQTARIESLQFTKTMIENSPSLVMLQSSVDRMIGTLCDLIGEHSEDSLIAASVQLLHSMCQTCLASLSSESVVRLVSVLLPLLHSVGESQSTVESMWAMTVSQCPLPSLLRAFADALTQSHTQSHSSLVSLLTAMQSTIDRCRNCDKEAVLASLPSLSQSLTLFLSHAQVLVRKHAVSVWVSLHLVLGAESIQPLTVSISSCSRKLIEIYVNKAKAERK